MSTALELTKPEREHYIRVLRQRASEPLKMLLAGEEQKRDVLLAQVREVAALIKQRLKARRVILFGSLAHRAWFNPHTDVDLAVEGLDAKAYWEAWKLAEEVIRDRSIDLIAMETASPSLTSAIERYGVEL